MRIGNAGVFMDSVFEAAAGKKPANVSINGDLLQKAKALKINLSATLEAALIESIKAQQRELWKAENRTAIAAYNRLVEQHGVFGDGLRGF